MSNPNPDQTFLNRAGRPPGTKNRATLAREEITRSIAIAIATKLTSDDIATITPLQVLLTAMRVQLQAGNLAGAVNCAALAAPFCHARPMSLGMDSPLPIDLQPDPDPQPDEPGPLFPVY